MREPPKRYEMNVEKNTKISTDETASIKRNEVLVTDNVRYLINEIASIHITDPKRLEATKAESLELRGLQESAPRKKESVSIIVPLEEALFIPASTPKPQQGEGSGSKPEGKDKKTR